MVCTAAAIGAKEVRTKTSDAAGTPWPAAQARYRSAVCNLCNTVLGEENSGESAE